MSGEGKVMVEVGGASIEHHELTEAQRRFLRARWVVANLTRERLDAAIAANCLEPDTVDVVEEAARVVRMVEDGDAEPEDLLPVVVDRLEDAFMWSVPNAELSEEQKRQVVEWCRRDGHGELADDVERSLDEEKEKGNG